MVFSSPWRPAELHARALVTSGGARDTRAVRSPRATLKVCFCSPCFRASYRARCPGTPPGPWGSRTCGRSFAPRRVRRAPRRPPRPHHLRLRRRPPRMTAGCPWNAKAGNLASRPRGREIFGHPPEGQEPSLVRHPPKLSKRGQWTRLACLFFFLLTVSYQIHRRDNRSPIPRPSRITITLSLRGQTRPHHSLQLPFARDHQLL